MVPEGEGMSFDVEKMDPDFIYDYRGLGAELWQEVLNDALAETMGIGKTMATDTVRVRYLAIAKHRRGGWSCAGLLGQPGVEALKEHWRLIVPVPVLLDWFGAQVSQPLESQGYYDLLMIDEQATRGAVKKAFYRLAKQWHPDVCKEPDADVHFAHISEAYEVLVDPAKRQKYNAIRAWKERQDEERQVTPRTWDVDMENYAPPLRSGDIQMEYYMSGRWMIADSITGWSDITDPYNGTYVSSWTRNGLIEEWS
jgi:hypothetical protein